MTQVLLSVPPAASQPFATLAKKTPRFFASHDPAGKKLGSGFTIARAALALTGFHSNVQVKQRFPTLKEQLQAFGGGIEISLLCALPKGSGLGTSSILSSTLLGTLSDLCNLGWS